MYTNKRSLLLLANLQFLYEAWAVVILPQNLVLFIHFIYL